MKIIQVTIYRPGSETGVAKVAERLSNSLCKKHDILYLCLGEKYEKKRINKHLTYLTIPSIPVKQGYIPKLSQGVSKKINGDLADFNPDIIHAHNIVFTGLISLVWALKNNIPYVVTLHSQPTQGIKYIIPQLSKSKIQEIINYSPTDSYVRHFLEKCSLIISLNISIDKSVNKVSPKVTLKKLPNGITLSKFYSIPIKKPEKEIIFSYLGMYMPRKNQRFLIQTFSHLPENYHLNLYGSISTGSKYVKKLINTIKTSGKTNVSIHNFLSQNQVTKMFAKTDYLVSASQKEVQSLVVIESLASGTPVIGLSNETIDEVIDESNGLRVNANVLPQEYAKRIKKYVQSTKSDYNKIANNSRKSTTRFDLDVVTNDLTRTYHKLVKNKQKAKKDTNKIYQLIPNQFQEFLAPFVENVNLPKQKNLSLKFYMKTTVILATLVWPIAKTIETLKRNRN